MPLLSLVVTSCSSNSGSPTDDSKEIVTVLLNKGCQGKGLTGFPSAMVTALEQVVEIEPSYAVYLEQSKTILTHVYNEFTSNKSDELISEYYDSLFALCSAVK